MAREWGGLRGRVLDAPLLVLGVKVEILRFAKDDKGGRQDLTHDLRMRGERTADAPSPYSAHPAPQGYYLVRLSSWLPRRYAVAPAWEAPIARRCWKHSRQ